MIRFSAPRSKKNSPGAAKNGKPNLTIIATEDIDIWPARLAGSVLLDGNFIMKPNCKMYSFYGTVSTQDGSFEGEGEEDAQVIPHSYVVEHPGDDLESENFMQNWLAVPCIIIEDYCDGSPAKVYGTECAPLQLQLSFTRNNEKTAYTMTFTSFAKTSWLPGRYSGSLSFTEPFIVADNTALALSAANGFQYKLAEGNEDAIAIDTNTLEHGQSITLFGAGGASPDTLSGSSTIVLTAQWVALAGAVISLKVFESTTGKILIETNRA